MCVPFPRRHFAGPGRLRTESVTVLFPPKETLPTFGLLALELLTFLRLSGELPHLGASFIGLYGEVIVTHLRFVERIVQAPDVFCSSPTSWRMA